MVQDTVIIVICIVIIILTIICGITYYCCKKKKTEKPKYQVSDNYSNVGSEFIFDQTKNSKVWLGQSGLNKFENQQRKERLNKQYETCAAAMRIATNYCRDPSLREGQRKIRDDLPCIGYRNDVKFYYAVSDTKLEKDTIGDAVLLLHIDLTQCPPTIPNILDAEEITQALGSFRCIDFNVDEQFRAFRLTLESFDHPYIASTYEAGLSRDKKHLFLFRDFFSQGSLRDHIYNTDLSQPYSEKYNRPGKGLPIPLIKKYGRQILEAMSYLSQCGIVHYHLHSGNVQIYYNDELDGNSNNKSNRGHHSMSLKDSLLKMNTKKDQYNDNGSIKLTGIENNLLGLLPKHPYFKHIVTLKKLYPLLNVELMLFGYILFEMICGVESPMPSPLDCIHEIEIQTNKLVPSEIKNILGRIFGDKSFGHSVTLDDIISLPFFAVANIPPIKTDTYTALKEENETVDKIRNISVLQCYYTYSRQGLLGDAAAQDIVVDMNETPTKKRKKRKKKKKRDKHGNMVGSQTPSQGQSLLTDASLLDDEEEDELFNE